MADHLTPIAPEANEGPALARWTFTATNEAEHATYSLTVEACAAGPAWRLFLAEAMQYVFLGSPATSIELERIS